MSTLKLAPDLSAPIGLAAATVFIAGTKGSGKTHNAGVIAEEMLSAGAHVVILDPLGVWWGLRHDASGGPGGFPIVILGGEHGDVPLVPTGGEAVAEFIVRSGQSCILDMSGFGANAEQDRFVTDLLHKLFRLKATDKGAVHLIMDEADMFIPQQAISKTEIPLLGATKTIITKGRSRGLSMTLITQRPQSIAKSAIEEADVVLCHRMQGVNAVKAMKAWTDLYATKEQADTFYESLPLLGNGECWVWSPNFLKKFQRVQFRRKHTFDSSRTPEPGEVSRKPKAAARVDLDKLTAEIKASAETAKANDPKALRQRVLELEKALAAKPDVKPETKIVEKPVVTDAQVKRVETLADRLEAEGRRRIEASEKLAESGQELIRTAKEFAVALGKAIAPAPAPAPQRPAAIRQPLRTIRPDSQTVREPRSDDGGGDLPKGERAVLVAIAQYPDGADREQLSVLTGYKRSSRDTYLQRLRERGYVDQTGDTLFATDGGVAALGDGFDPLPTGEALRDYWLQRLPEGERRVLEVLIASYPDAVQRDALDEPTGYKRSSRDTYLQRLAARKLVANVGRGEVKASDNLF